MESTSEPPRIRVVVRKRPLTGKELVRNDKDIVEVIGSKGLIVEEMK